MLAILDLFDERAVSWSVEEIHAELGYTRSTLYRYLKVLTDAGFLTSMPGLGYALGPRIIELDHKIRVSDPLLQAAKPVMTELVADIPGVALLCRRYRQKVLCVHQETSTAAFTSTYERGRARPLLEGAASVAILAWLPGYQIGKLYKAMPEAFEAAGHGDNQFVVVTMARGQSTGTETGRVVVRREFRQPITVAGTETGAPSDHTPASQAVAWW